jgi:alpha-galactosidase
LVGITSDAGVTTCNGNPGSLGFEAEDVDLWNRWEIDYVKYGNCNNRGVPALKRYSDMANEISIIERPMFYAISNYGNENVTEWAPQFAQSWRTTLDVQWGEQKGNSFFGV